MFIQTEKENGDLFYSNCYNALKIVLFAMAFPGVNIQFRIVGFPFIWLDQTNSQTKLPQNDKFVIQYCV